MNLFKAFLKILLINVISSTIPFGYVGMVFGFPAVLVSSIAITLIFRKQLIGQT